MGESRRRPVQGLGHEGDQLGRQCMRGGQAPRAPQAHHMHTWAPSACKPMQCTASQLPKHNAGFAASCCCPARQRGSAPGLGIRAHRGGVWASPGSRRRSGAAECQGSRCGLTRAWPSRQPGPCRPGKGRGSHRAASGQGKPQRTGGGPGGGERLRRRGGQLARLAAHGSHSLCCWQALSPAGWRQLLRPPGCAIPRTGRGGRPPRSLPHPMPAPCIAALSSGYLKEFWVLDACSAEARAGRCIAGGWDARCVPQRSPPLAPAPCCP